MESSPNTNPPPSSAAALSSPSGRPAGKTGSPPWTQIVRGPESESPADICLSENQPESNADSKKPPAAAWNKKPPANGSVLVDSSGPAVMGGAASWPALSESTKASPKLSPSDSGSAPAPVPALQVTGVASSSSSPLQSPSGLTSQKPTTSNANHFSSNNHGRPARQKSMKRDSGGNSQANGGGGGYSHQGLPQGEGLNNHNSSSVKPSSSSGGNDRDNNSQNHATNRESGLRNDHHQPRSNSFRRGNSGGPHSRGGDGNYGGRRGGDQDRGVGNHDWNHQRSFNGRDAPPPPMQSGGVGPRGFVRTTPPPVSTTTFVHPGGPAPMRPFMNPMGMPEGPMIYYSPAVPFVAPVHAPMFFPAHADQQQLLAKIVNQIDYYFSNENLIKDTFLRRNMDQNGWVPVSLIASFKKVTQLTDNIELILDAVRSSTVVEAQGEKIRRRDDWMRWIMPPTVQFLTTSSLQSLETPNVATLSADIQSVSLNKRIIDAKTEVLSKSSLGNLNNALHTNNDGAASSGC